MDAAVRGLLWPACPRCAERWLLGGGARTGQGARPAVCLLGGLGELVIASSGFAVSVLIPVVLRTITVSLWEEGSGENLLALGA